MASWRNIKWHGNETLHEFSYILPNWAKHQLDTFKQGLPSNVCVNLVHIYIMQATMHMATRFITVSKGTSPDANAIANIPFMAAWSHDELASGMYQKPAIPKEVPFQDSALLSGLQNINKKLKSMDYDLYALRRKNKKIWRQFKSPGWSNFRNRNWYREQFLRFNKKIPW